MDLTSLLGRFPGIRLIQDGDQEKIFKIFHDYPMVIKGIELVYNRSPQFSKLLRQQAASFRTLVLEKESRIGSFFSFSWGPRYVNGEIKNVAYIGDFRVSDVRMGAALWRKFYAEFIKEFKTSSGVDFCLTAILESNRIAMQSLVKNGPKFGFFYHFLSSQMMINIFSRKPWCGYFYSGFDIKTNSGKKDLEGFIDRDQRGQLFGYVFSGGNSELNHRQRFWENNLPENFLLAYRGQELVACVLPWSPSASKKMVVQKIPLGLNLVLMLAGLCGARLPKLNEHIETLYLTHLSFAEGLSDQDKKEITLGFVNFIFSNRKNYNFHMLAVADPRQDLAGPLSSKYFQQAMGVNLFEVSTSERPSFPPDVNVSFEMALV